MHQAITFLDFGYMIAAKEFWAVQKEVAELIKGRILVGHALHNDLKVVNIVCVLLSQQVSCFYG